MPWIKPQRNLDDSIHWGKLRKTIDLVQAQIHDDLSEAYYDHWRQGDSFVVTLGTETFDKQSTEAETFDYWNQLQRAMTHFYTVYFHVRNLEQPPPFIIDEKEYRYTYIDTDVDPWVIDEDLLALAAIECRDLRDNKGIDFSDFLSVDIDEF